MSAFMFYLEDNRVKGVRLATYSSAAGEFFRKNGFVFLFNKTRTYFKHLLNNPVIVSVYGRKPGGERRGTGG